MSKGVLAFRFDVDSVRCLKEGVPRLRRIAKERGVRFTFFVTMGRTFDVSATLRHRLGKMVRGSASAGPRRGNRSAEPQSANQRRDAMSACRKLGWRGVIETVARNPHLGRTYRDEIDALHEEGHELGLHGGANHAVWQRNVHRLGPEQLEVLLRPAFDDFTDRYGSPRGFASPGFEWNDDVLDLVDRRGFVYASDMRGEAPFRPSHGTQNAICKSSHNGTTQHRHWQVPVNVVGDGMVPVIEQGLARGHDAGRIADEAVAQIRERRFALMYDHPYVAGVHHAILDKIIERVAGEYDVVTVEEYLARWRRSDG